MDRDVLNRDVVEIPMESSTIGNQFVIDETLWSTVVTGARDRTATLRIDGDSIDYLQRFYSIQTSVVASKAVTFITKKSIEKSCAIF